MGDLAASADSISAFKVILWCFYPMATLVLAELILRAVDDDDDDTNGGKGMRVQQMQPVAVPSGA
tara:strand:- start:1111 stop:1305 length:195 start_codon:yes stop_codon:yes gene_type:complete